MTSEEIRKLQSKQFIKSEDDPVYMKLQWLSEIAAQLAELNEHFRKADESVFGVKDNAKK